MQGFTKFSGHNSPKVIVLDTAAFLAAVQLQLYNITLYTVPAVIDEVKDYESRVRLEFASMVERFLVKAPEAKYFSEALEMVKKLRVLEKLSTADLQVLALSLELKDRGLEPVVITDDYILQRVLIYIGIDFRAVKTMGVKL